ncbi:MAG: LacI family DNA-binding transcriptional regulator [Eubacterium sp.]|nr:LacI family DNA-binding transcriptional regulator [Eubacterium sp.]
MTIREIAEFHGVVPSTVSLVLNDKPGVRKTLREEIQKTLIQNGYEIKRQQIQKGSILFIYYKSTDYLSARKDNTITSILSGISAVCEEKKYSYTMVEANAETIEDLLTSLAPSEYCGAILLGTEYYEAPADYFFNTQIPLVVLDGYFPEYPLDTVNINNSCGVHEAISLLLKNGHKRIGYLKSSIEYGCLRDRKECLYRSLESLGIGKPFCQIEVEQRPDQIHQTVTNYLKSHAELPDAFFADNDIIAVSAIQALQREGHRIPEDISVIGFDDSSICTIVSPYLTTVRTHMEQMACAAAERLITLIEHGHCTYLHTQVGTSLIERETVFPRS